MPNVTSETHRKKDDFGCLFLLLLLWILAFAAAAVGPRLKPIENDDLSHFFLLLLLLLLFKRNRVEAAAAAVGPRLKPIENDDEPNRTKQLLNVPSEILEN